MLVFRYTILGFIWRGVCIYMRRKVLVCVCLFWPLLWGMCRSGYRLFACFGTFVSSTNRLCVCMFHFAHIKKIPSASLIGRARIEKEYGDNLIRLAEKAAGKEEIG